MKKKTYVIIGILVAVVAAIIIFFLVKDNKEVRLSTTHAEENTLQIVVTSSGSVQPVDQIDVGTQVSGVIEKIYVDFNDHVQAGQLLAELDKSVLAEKVAQSKDALASAQSDLQLAQSNYNRTKQLYDEKAETLTNLEAATNRLDIAKVAVSNSTSNLKQAQTNLSYADIKSPISGIVQDRAVEEGQTVAASFNTPTLFVIANNLKNMQVQTNVDEADIGGVNVGQKVTFTVDSYPNDTFNGTVKQIRLQPVTTNNVVTYTVIIDAPNPDEKLLPGMTAYSNIITQEATGISVPVEALSFNPSQEVLKDLTIKPLENQAPGQKTVWIRTGEKSMEERAVKTGTSDRINTIITEGLNGGEEIVLSAAYEKKQKKQAASNPLIPQRPAGRGSGGSRR